jgi:DNA-binding transcriptional ArsR family regulator
VVDDPARLSVKRLDTAALKALAHPLRVRLLGSLRREGPATASQLARRLDESSGATSYHLRVLAGQGFVVDDEREASGRERWWRAAQDMTSWSSTDFQDDPDAAAAEQFLVGTATRAALEAVDRWLDQRPEADPAWIDAAELSDYVLRVPPEGLRSLLDDINRMVQDRLAAGELDRRDDPGATRVRLLLYAVPDEPVPAVPPEPGSGA